MHTLIIIIDYVVCFLFLFFSAFDERAFAMGFDSLTEKIQYGECDNCAEKVVFCIPEDEHLLFECRSLEKFVAPGIRMETDGAKRLFYYPTGELGFSLDCN